MNKCLVRQVVLWLGLCLFFALLGWWQLSSLGNNWTSAYLGAGELEGWLWRYWWMKKMLVNAWTSSASIGYCLWVTVVAGSYPETGNVFDLEILSWPLELVFGAPLYYNVKCLLVLALNGVAATVLGWKILRSRLGAVVCGLVLALSPYCLNEIANGRVRQAVIFPLVFYVVCLLTLWKRPSFSSAVYCGVWGGLTSATYLYYGMAAAMFTGIFVVWCVVSSSYGKVSWPRVGFGMLGFVLAVMCCVPFVGSYVDRQQKGETLPEMLWQRDFPSLDELTSPDMSRVLKQNDPLLNSLQRFRSDSLPWQYAFMPQYSRNLPWVFAVLALAAWPVSLVSGRFARNSGDGEDVCRADSTLLTPSQIVPWLLGALFFYLLTLGPYFKDGFSGLYLQADKGGIVSPYVWMFKYIPAFARLFSPVRMSAMMLICVGCLSGACVAQLASLVRMPRFLKVVTCLVITFMVVHGLRYSGAVPVPVSSLVVPEYYYTLAQQPYCTVVELPFRTGDSLQYFQTVHEKKLLLGWSDGAVPPGFPDGNIKYYTRVFEGLPQNTFLQYLEGLNVEPTAQADFLRNDYLAVVQKADVRYLIVHERGCHQISQNGGEEHYRQILATLETLFGPPVDVCREMVYESGLQPRDYQMAVFAVIRPDE